MRVSRQTINKNINVIERKISQALYEAARINKVDIRIIKPLTGILVGYSRTLNTEVVIYLSVKHGLQVWYKHKGDCNNCEFHEECKKILLDEFEIRKIRFQQDIRSFANTNVVEVHKKLVQKLLEYHQKGIRMQIVIPTLLKLASSDNSEIRSTTHGVFMAIFKSDPNEFYNREENPLYSIPNLLWMISFFPEYLNGDLDHGRESIDGSTADYIKFDIDLEKLRKDADRVDQPDELIFLANVLTGDKTVAQIWIDTKTGYLAGLMVEIDEISNNGNPVYAKIMLGNFNCDVDIKKPALTK